VPEKIVKGFLDIFDGILGALIDAVNVVIDVYNAIVKVLNKIIKALKVVGIKVSWEIPTIPPVDKPDLSNLIDNRIGMLKIEYDQFTVPKIFIISRGSQSKYNKLHPSNATILTARNLWDQFHVVDSMVPSDEFPNGNQCMFIPFSGIPFTFTDYEMVKRNNMIFDHDGNPQELVSLKWRPRKNEADILVRFSYLWSCNLTQQYLEPDGR
jgi:hypothetical protein